MRTQYGPKACGTFKEDKSFYYVLKSIIWHKTGFTLSQYNACWYVYGAGNDTFKVHCNVPGISVTSIASGHARVAAVQYIVTMILYYRLRTRMSDIVSLHSLKRLEITMHKSNMRKNALLYTIILQYIFKPETFTMPCGTYLIDRVRFYRHILFNIFLLFLKLV